LRLTAAAWRWWGIFILLSGTTADYLSDVEIKLPMIHFIHPLKLMPVYILPLIVDPVRPTSAKLLCCA